VLLVSSEMPFFVMMANITVTEMRSQARRLQAEQGGDGLNFAGLFADGRGGDNRPRVIKITRSLKGLARELNVPIIAYLSWSGESKPPISLMMSDLRESGSEQDADIVIMLYRDEYYQNDTEQRHCRSNYYKAPQWQEGTVKLFDPFTRCNLASPNRG